LFQRPFVPHHPLIAGLTDPSGQSRLAGVRAPTIGGGSQSVMTAAGGEAWKAADMGDWKIAVFT
jgi:hypothetical protein